MLGCRNLQSCGHRGANKTGRFEQKVLQHVDGAGELRAQNSPEHGSDEQAVHL